jgi:hypothetical protein
MLRRYFPIVLAAVVAVLAVSALSAVAATSTTADTSWKVTDGTTFSTVTTVGAVYSTYLGTNTCPGVDSGGEIEFRARTASGWSAQKIVNRNCYGASLANPLLTRDSNNGRLFIVWAQTDVLHPKLAGIEFISSKNNGRSWSKPKTVLKTPHGLTPANFAAAARGDLYIMAEKDSSSVVLTPAFTLIGYNENTGGAKTKNLASGGGNYRASFAQGAMSLYATQSGLIASWQTTDAGGLALTYVADTSSSHKGLKLTTREQLNAPAPTSGEPVGRLTFSLGANGQLYLLAEQKTTLADTFSEWWYDYTEHRFTALPNASSPTVLVLSLQGDDVIAPYLGLGLQVDAEGNSYLVYTDFNAVDRAKSPNTPGCFTGTWPCVRTVGGTQSANAVYVLQRSVAGAFSLAPVPYPFAITQHPGDDIVEWIQGGSGIETVSTAFGGVRTVLRNGWEDVTTSGTVGGSEANYNIVLSAPLVFAPYTPTQ